MISRDINPSRVTCELLLNEAKRKGLVDAMQWIKTFMDQREKVCINKLCDQ
jgi:hypothetical protein